jgi:hypothetical protein
MKSVVKFGHKNDIIVLFCMDASEYVRNLICTHVIIIIIWFVLGS